MSAASTGSRPLRRPRARRNRRHDLIRSGIPLLSRAERPTRVEDVTAAAGTAKGTFYLYFPSWGAYLAAVRDHLLAEYQREMKSRLGALVPGTYWSVFDSEIEHFIRWMLGHGNLHRSVFHGAEVDRAVPTELSAGQAIVGLLELGKEYGRISPEVDGAVCARLVLGTLHSAVAAHEAAPDADVIRESIRFLRAAVAADTP